MVKVAAEAEASSEKIAFPQNEEELNALLREAAQQQRHLDKIEKDKKDALARVNARFEGKARPHVERLEQLTPVLLAYIKANRKKLTDDGKRQSFETADTIVKFREDGTGTLEVTDEKAAIASLEKRRGGRAFVEVKKTLKKDALKKWIKENARRRHVPGVRLLFKPSLSVQLKLTASEKRRKVKPTVLIREIDD